MSARTGALLFSLALYALGLLLPLWPLSVLAVLLAAFVGRPVTAILLGLLLDLLWGPPPGAWHALQFPLTLAAALAAGAALFLRRYLRGREVEHRL